MSLDGRVAVVTGAGSGIGAAIARSLAAAGAGVVIGEIEADLATSVVDEIRGGGGSAAAVIGDIRTAAAVEALSSAALQFGGGRVDILVNNVGDFRPAARDFLRSDEAQWQAMYEINLLHVLRCTHAFLPAMVEQGSGSIVNVSTVEAYRGIPGHTVYSALKAGVSAFTKSLAIEVGRHGVRVNAIAPDLMDTSQTPAEAMLRGRDPAAISTWVPLGRFGQTDDCAAVVVFLASDDARFVTGHTVPVDGGTLSASGWFGRADGKGWTNLPNEP